MLEDRRLLEIEPGLGKNPALLRTQVALLKPTQVDEMSGYRYYSVAQLRQLHRILALRDLGFSWDRTRVRSRG